MPYARILPSHQLQPIDLVAPGFKGLNLTESAGVLSPAFCTEALNAVIDFEGRLQTRAGWTALTTTPIPSSPVIRTLHEYVKEDGTVTTIVAWNGGISNSIVNPSGNDISGSVTDANGTWKFVNFNGLVIGFQAGQKPISWNGTGNFANITESDGTAPQGGVGLAAFGRIWAVDSDNQTIKYSGLLNSLQWATGGAGSIDMSSVWINGTDIVTGLAAFNNQLVVFGRRHIIFYGDKIGNVLGIDPTQLEVTDSIPGVGSISQFAVQPVGETDVLFLSSEGVQSIRRLIVQRSAPVSNLSKYVRDSLLLQVSAENVANIRSTYNALSGFYLLSLPASNTTWAFDQTNRWTDEEGDEVAIVTRWSNAPTALLTRLDNITIGSIGGGKVHQNLGSSDDGTSYRFIYQSPWLDLGEEVANRIKILKRLGAIMVVSRDSGLIFKWAVDFKPDFQSLTVNVAGSSGNLAEYGIAEWGIAEFGGGGFALRILKMPARNAVGQYYKIGIETTVTGALSIQQAELFAKIGRLA